MNKPSIKAFYRRRLRPAIWQISHKWIVTTGRVRSSLLLPVDSDLRIIRSSHRYEPIQVTKPLFCVNDPIQSAQLHNYLQNPNLRHYEAKIIAAKEVLVKSPTMIHRWKRIAFLEALLDEEKHICYPRHVIDFETMPLRSSKRWPAGILLALPLYSNYFHWMVELLPRLQLLEEHPEINALPLIIPADPPKFVRESLQLSGYEDRVQFLRRGVHSFDTLYIPSALSPPSHPSPAAIAWLRAKLGGSIVSASTYKKRRLYVSRRDAPTRFATNELDLEAMLKGLNFETVKMSDYTVAEQIVLFSQAKVVVGIHGAALANLVFCSRETYVLELFLEGWFTNAFYHISLIQQLHYGYLICKKDGEGQYVPIAALRTLIMQMLKHCENNQSDIPEPPHR
jgi:hypothetical protein